MSPHFWLTSGQTSSISAPECSASTASGASAKTKAVLHLAQRCHPAPVTWHDEEVSDSWMRTEECEWSHTGKADFLLGGQTGWDRPRDGYCTKCTTVPLANSAAIPNLCPSDSKHTSQKLTNNLRNGSCPARRPNFFFLPPIRGNRERK